MRSKTSKRWLKEHFDDKYVQQAQADGWRSRAAFKLLEIQDKDRLIKPGMTVVDLGAAPGGWTQVAAKLVGDNGFVLASDILDMDPFPGVEFVKGDFKEAEVYDRILKSLGDRKVDLVISDMAPNMSGMASVDQPGSMYLVELALDMARQVLKPNGHFVAKVFQGEGFDEFIKEARSAFAKVVIRKPKASRPRSREVYVVAKGFRPG